MNPAPQTPGLDDPCLTARDVAQKLGVSRRTVGEWTSKKRLRSYKVGGWLVRYTQRDINDFLDGCLRAARRPGPAPGPLGRAGYVSQPRPSAPTAAPIGKAGFVLAGRTTEGRAA